MHNFPSYMSIWIGGYNYTSASLNSNKTHWLESFAPVKKCKMKAQVKLMYGFQYENQIKYIHIL